MHTNKSLVGWLYYLSVLAVMAGGEHLALCHLLLRCSVSTGVIKETYEIFICEKCCIVRAAAVYGGSFVQVYGSLQVVS